MPKLVIECDLDNPGVAHTRVLLDGVPVGAVQHVDFAQNAESLPHARLHLLDAGDQEEALAKLESYPWLLVVRVDPKTRRHKPTPKTKKP